MSNIVVVPNLWTWGQDGRNEKEFSILVAMRFRKRLLSKMETEKM